VQIPIPFIETQMPDNFSEAYQQMIRSLPETKFKDGDNILLIAQSAITIIRDSMDFLKIYCEDHGFIDQASEITFFKVVKPQFHAQLILWLTIYEIELNRPVGSRKKHIKYLNKKMTFLEEFFSRHRDFFQYYRGGETDRDKIYFLRNATNPFTNMDPNSININKRLTCLYDSLVATILGNTLIEKYLKWEISKLKQEESRSTKQAPSSKLHWTASKTGLVELIYSLQCGGVFNNGKAQVQEIADEFQEHFDIKLINYYHMFNELRSRKKNRTSFMQTLQDKLAAKMDDLEGG
jgi:hypothetical protein